jgi:hypothetical protein
LEIAENQNKLDNYNTALRQEFERKLEGVRIRLSSIERGLGDQKYFAVQNFFLPHHGKSPESVKKISYFPDGNLFAPMDADRWQYAKTTELDLVAQPTALDVKSAPSGRTQS